MTDNVTEFQNFWDAYKWPEPKPVFYRLYHDEHGVPVVYTMEDLPGKYIEITQDQYNARDHRVRVVDGNIIPLSSPAMPKLVRSDQGTPCYPTNVALVVGCSEPHQRWTINDQQ